MPDETRWKEMDSGGRGFTRTRLDKEVSGRVWWLGVGEIDAITAVCIVPYLTLSLIWDTLLAALPYNLYEVGPEST